MRASSCTPSRMRALRMLVTPMQNCALVPPVATGSISTPTRAAAWARCAEFHCGAATHPVGTRPRRGLDADETVQVVIERIAQCRAPLEQPPAGARERAGVMTEPNVVGPGALESCGKFGARLAPQSRGSARSAARRA